MGNELSSCQPCRVDDESAVEIIVESDCRMPCDYIGSQFPSDELGVEERSHGDCAAMLPVREETEELWRCKSSMASEDDTMSTRSPYSDEGDDLSSEGSATEAHHGPPAALSAEYKGPELPEAAANEDDHEAQSPAAAVWRLTRTPALDNAFGELPDPQVVFQSTRGKKPIFSKHIPGVSLSAVRDALEADGGCLHRYPCEALNCHGMSATTWDSTVVGDKQHLMYKLAVPRDFPDFVYKMLGLPDVVDGATVSCISNSDSTGTELVLLQRSRTEGVPSSDRLQAQNVYCFQAGVNGHGVTMLQWTEVVWTQPCPWTMRPIAAVIERKVKGEAKATAIDFQHILQDVIKRQNFADH
jgi:hypothetical protein